MKNDPDYDSMHRAINAGLDSFLEEMAPYTQPFWERVESFAARAGAERRLRVLEESRWEDDGGVGVRTEPVTWRDLAMGSVREYGRRYGN